MLAIKNGRVYTYRTALSKKVPCLSKTARSKRSYKRERMEVMRSMKKVPCLFLAVAFIFLTCGCNRNNVEYSSDDIIYEYIYQNDDTVHSIPSEDHEGGIRTSESNPSDVSSIKDSNKNNTSNSNISSSGSKSRPLSETLSDEEIAEYIPTSVTITLYDTKTSTYGICHAYKANINIAISIYYIRRKY